MISLKWTGGQGKGNENNPDRYNMVIEPVRATDLEGNLLYPDSYNGSNLYYLGPQKSKMPVFDEEHCGEWYAIETRIKLNTPENSGGLMELWIDDVFQYSSYDEDEEGDAADKTALAAAITAEIGADRDNPVYALRVDDYTDDSWAAYVKAIGDAILVEKDSGAGQNTVDDVYYALLEAIAALVRRDAACTALIYVTGPDIVASGGGATATYMISAEQAPIVGGIEFEFEVDGSYLSSNSFTALSGFAFFGDGNYGTPVYWKNDGGGIWVGKVTLLDFGVAGISGDINIFELVFNAIDGALGEAALRINYMKISAPDGNIITPIFINDEYKTEFVKYYLPYDLNKDGTVDLYDLTYAVQFLLAKEGDANWDIAKTVDFDNSGYIDIEDLILILANYTIPYYG